MRQYNDDNILKIDKVEAQSQLMSSSAVPALPTTPVSQSAAATELSVEM